MSRQLRTEPSPETDAWCLHPSGIGCDFGIRNQISRVVTAPFRRPTPTPVRAPHSQRLLPRCWRRAAAPSTATVARSLCNHRECQGGWILHITVGDAVGKSHSIGARVSHSSSSVGGAIPRSGSHRTSCLRKGTSDGAHHGSPLMMQSLLSIMIIT